VGALCARAALALRRWLGLGADLSLSWIDLGAGEPIGELSVRVEAGERHLRLVLRDAAPDARWQDDGIQVTCRRQGDRDLLGDPVLHRWLASLDARFAPTSRADGSSSDLRAALAAARQFTGEGIADWMLRRAESTHEGALGMLIVGHRCNQDCTICFQGRHWPDPPKEMVFRWLDELAQTGIDTVVLTGGEPTVYSWLPDLIARAAGPHGMRVLLQTNAVMLAKQSYLRRLLDAGLSEVLVALHSADGSVSDGLTRAPGTHRRTIEGIRNLLDAGLGPTLNCCVDAATVHGLGDHARFIVDRLVGSHRGKPMCRVEYSQPGAYLDHERMLRAIVPLDVVRPHLLEAVRLLRQASVPVRWSHPCGFPPCLLHAEPALIQWELREDYGQAIADRDFAAPCRRCAARTHCVGLRPEYLSVHGTRGLEPFSSVPVVGA
jgi:uncharacterized Fe-S cluster-containing radical SAM superfamily protein